MKIEYTNSALNHPEMNQGALQNSGPLQAAGPLQNSNPLQNAGPLQSAGPVQSIGPIDTNMSMPSVLDIGDETGMMEYYLQDFIFVPFKFTSFQNLMENLPGIDPTSLVQIINQIIEAPKSNGTLTVTPLPPVIYDPTNPSQSSPN